LRRNYLIARVGISMTTPRTFPLVLRHAISRLVLNRRYPGYAILGLTNRCNCNCQHCYAYQYRQCDTGDEMSTTEWFGILDQIRELKIPRAHLSGGEPTLRKDLPELVGYCREKGIVPILETNGTFLSESLVSDLKRAGIGGIVVSLDSSAPDRHDQVRHLKGCYEKAVEGLERCVAQGVPCVISTFANREKLTNNDLENLMRLGKRIGVRAVRLIPPIMSGKWINDDIVRLNPEDVARIESALDPSVAYFRGMYFGAGCAALEKGTFYVSPSGEIQPCAVVPLSFGSVREERLSAILKKIWEHPMCDLQTKGCVMNDDRFRERYENYLDQESSPKRIGLE